MVQQDTSPSMLNFGAVAPEEIVLSMLAEIIQCWWQPQANNSGLNTSENAIRSIRPTTVFNLELFIAQLDAIDLFMA